MSTVWRHIGGRFLGAFVAAFAILALLLIAVDAMLHLASLVESEATLGSALQLLIERTAGSYLQYLIPIATFVAAFVCAGASARHHEVLALKAAGISPLLAFAPVLVLASAVALVHLAATESFGVQAAAALSARRSSSASAARMRAGAVWYHAGRVVYSVQAVDARSGAVRGIRVYERDAEGRLLRSIRAASARRLSPLRWSFSDALVREFDPLAPSAAPREQRGATLELKLAADRSPELRAEELAGLPLGALWRYVSAALAARADPGAVRVALHNRLSEPLTILAFAALATALALRSEERRSLARAALQSALLLAAFLFARDYGTSFAARAGAGGALFPWLTLGGFAALACQQLQRVAR